MKVGTITYHRAVNYGAVLQTYALQKVLDKLEIENEVIDYRADYIEWIYKPFCMRDRKSVGDFFKILRGAPIKNKKRNQFFRFINENIRVSKPYTKETLSTSNEVYDCFLTGSDQVFNLECSNYDENYFLNFVNEDKKRNSYAASFGFDDAPEADVEKYKKLLTGFKNISVREKQGVKIAKEIADKDAVEVLDPTLLISGNEWREIVKHTPKYDKKYILIYALKPSEMLMEFANELKRLTGYDMVFIKDSLTKEGQNVLSKDVKYVKDVDPFEFVNYFANAEYIITNSFHGTAFSINFNKKFFTEFLDPALRVNSRLENILEMIGLKSRKIESLDSLTLADIDYTKVNQVLKERKEVSLEYLKKVIKG